MGTAVFFNLPGATGHINPSLGIVSELIRSGERVVYYAGPDSHDKLAALGAVPRQYQPLFDYHHDFAIASDLVALFTRLFQISEEATIGLAARVAADKPDYIIYDSCTPWGKLVAQRLGVPSIYFVTHIITTPWMLASRLVWSPRLWQMAASSTSPRSVLRAMGVGIGIRRRVMDLVAGLGLPYRGWRTHLHEMFNGGDDLKIAVTSPDYQPYSNRLGHTYRFVGASIPAARDDNDLTFDRAPGQRLIYVSLGTVHNLNNGFYQLCMQVLGNGPHRVLMSVGQNTDIADLGPIPANFTVRNNMPQLEILKQADLFISHGGMNSINESLYFGVPLVMVPQQVEQAFSAFRIAQFGAGQVIIPRQLTAQRLHREVEEILGESAYKTRAASFGATLNQGGHRRAAREILAQVRDEAVEPRQDMVA